MTEAAAGQESHGHDPGLLHHFDTREQQFDSGKLGMWIFLATEVLLFGGLFVAYAVYRANHPEIFIYAHQFLDKTWGGINTLVLICSSLTMAWGVRAAQLGQRRLLVVLLSLTILGGFAFNGLGLVDAVAGFYPSLFDGLSGDGVLAYILFAFLEDQENNDPGFEIAGTDPASVPEPATLALLMGSLLLLAGTRAGRGFENVGAAAALAGDALPADPVGDGGGVVAWGCVHGEGPAGVGGQSMPLRGLCKGHRR